MSDMMQIIINEQDDKFKKTDKEHQPQKPNGEF
jgi:hypothetical protein